MLTVEDRLDIAELYARYTHTVDDADHVGWSDCFTSDGYLSVPLSNVHAQGSKALQAFSQAFARRSGGLERHLVTNLLVTPAGSGATGRCYLMMLIGGSGAVPPRPTTTGIYRDDLLRTEHGWRFSARVLQVDQHNEGAGAQ